MSEEEFKKRYRLAKFTVRVLVGLLNNNIVRSKGRNCALNKEEMILLTLRFYASGSFLITASDYCGVSVSTDSRVVKKVSYVIAALSQRYIYMPRRVEDMKLIGEQFYDIARFPKVLGCIDCTHIKIQSPGGNDPEIYRNRKGYFSLNVQVICNSELVIRDIVARWPRSAHDSNIFNNSRIKS